MKSIFRLEQHGQCLGTVSKLCSDTFLVAKEVRGINFTAGTEEHWQISDISELGTRRVKRWWGKNQGFMLISNLYSSTTIGCGGDLQPIRKN